MFISNEELARVTELTRRGQLMEATRAIQAALGARDASSGVAASGLADIPLPPEAKPAPRFNAIGGEDIVDVPFRPVTQPGSTFREDFFAWGAKQYRYRLFVPSGKSNADSPRPLLVMLHGCKQDSDDFARGTDMNAIAQRHDCLVLYPEQLNDANTMRCWNWFAPQHQTRGQGEPGMIAALTLHIAARHNGDLQHTYIAGLSAGGAMAALTAGLYPEVFAAVGVHSGLAVGAATDVASAFAAMRTGKRKTKPLGAPKPPLPTIVFQGTADKTVAPGNADAIVDDALAAWTHAGVALDKSTRSAPAQGANDRGATKTLFTDSAQRVVLERWTIATGPHAWSGGNPKGSFTDPRGPNASEAMVEFFLRHSLAVQKNPTDLR
jgi:poly(hydroxyalkanoate) depolymerase family esterase